MTVDRSHEPVAVNRVAFRHGSIELPWEAGRYTSTVEVLIDDVELSVRLREVTRRGVVPMLAGDIDDELAVWGPSPEAIPEADMIPDGLVPVATCGCTTFGCGGACARVEFQGDLVVWRDFHEVLSPDEAIPVALGNFVFDRRQYEEARRAFVRAATSEG
jgi:hypothetical protein